MAKRAVLYARVSSEDQAKGDAVSIDSQLADMRSLCERNGWQVYNTFIDCENYTATQAPKKGKVVNPSGERADRPHFLAMLETIKTGDVDLVLCWRDDRIMRHPRVAVALEDALDVGDGRRGNKGKITLHDATGAIIDRFTLSIKAVIWREENKRRSERIKMGKVGTLQKGRWPGKYGRFGYVARMEPGKRGCIIELGNPAEVQTVRDIFNWYDQGLTVRTISKKLITRGDWQTDKQHIYPWNPTLVARILRAEDYTGVAKWEFDDVAMTIEIPAIVSREQWERVQKRLDNNRSQSSRNAKRTFILHHLTVCGECGATISPGVKRHYYGRLASGEIKKYYYDPPAFYYRCTKAAKVYEGVNHPMPYNFEGNALEWAVWRYLVDNGIKQPDLIIEQVQNRQQQLMAQGEDVAGDINRGKVKLVEIEQERTFYQRQAARGKISEQEFDLRMAETLEASDHWRAEIERLQELRDNTAKVKASLDYAEGLLRALEQNLSEIDHSPDELAQLPEKQLEIVLKARQKVIRALCDRIVIYAGGRIVVEGLLDGSELSQFELHSTCIAWLSHRCGK